MSELQVELIPALSDNYMFLLFEPVSGASGIVDPAEAAPVLEALAKKGALARFDHQHPPSWRSHCGQSRTQAKTGAKLVGPKADAGRIRWARSIIGRR